MSNFLGSVQNDDSHYFNKLSNWLSTNSVPSNNTIDKFLNNLDNFNLDQYIKAIHFVIHHPKLRDAIQNFIAPVIE